MAMDRVLAVVIALLAALLIAVDGPGPPAVAPTETIAPWTPRPAASVDVLDPDAPRDTTNAPAPTPPPAPAPRAVEGARIVIERLAIDLPLVAGDVARDVPRDGFAGATPEYVALVFPGSALPGTGGNTYVYSHARDGMFLTLWQARVGDHVVLRWPDGFERHYLVTRVVPRASVADTTWLAPDGPERLTLQTSTGPDASDPRFIVVASPVEGGP